jgi:hypothetical protein
MSDTLRMGWGGGWRKTAPFGWFKASCFALPFCEYGAGWRQGGAPHGQVHTTSVMENRACLMAPALRRRLQVPNQRVGSHTY